MGERNVEEQKRALAQMVESVATGLYQQDKERGVEQMESLITELLKLVKEDSLGLNMEAVNQVLVAAMNALETRNYVLLADILSYDLKELLV